jgi:GNAT superfamily N-acetyltransferase
MAPKSERADIRPATEADLAAVVRLLEAQFREHAIDTPAEAIEGAVGLLLRDPERGRILVATLEGAPVGLAALSFVFTLEHAARSAWLEELYVEPAQREGGIGAALLEAACAAAAGAGAVAVDLEVDAGHARAARLYERSGFRPLPRARFVRRLTPG